MRWRSAWCHFRPEDPQVKSIVAYRDQLAFVVNPNHPLAKKKTLSIRDLGQENFIAHNVPSPQREKVIQAFARHKTPLQMGVELPSLEAIKRFVALGNGVALVPQLTRGAGHCQRAAGARAGAGAAVRAQVAAGASQTRQPVARGGGVFEGGGGVCGGERRSVRFSA